MTDSCILRTAAVQSVSVAQLDRAFPSEGKGYEFESHRVHLNVEYGMTEICRDPIFEETQEILNRLGIEAVLFDLDDTLIYTSEIFTRCMENYASQVAKKIGMETSQVMEVMRAINDEEYKRMGVNPKRWEKVVEKLATQLSHGEREIIESLDALMAIYSTIPRIRQGVLGMLKVFKESGVKMVLVTHANVDWTYFKLDKLGFWDFFDVVVIADENGHKKSEDWQRGLDSVATKPQNSLIVGDSLGGDIRPGHDLGARTVWMPSPWSVYRQGEVPENTVIINEITELLTALGRLE